MIHSIQRATILCILAFIPQHIIAQTSSILFHSRSIRDGLPDNRVDVIVRDRQGYIWCSTIFGVCRYDGYEFKSYQLGDKARGTKDIQCDRLGNLWCLYDMKLMRYDPMQDEFNAIAPAQDSIFYSKGVTTLLETDTSVYWITNRRGGLARINAQAGVEQTYLFRAGNVVRMIPATRDHLWLGMSDHSILQFDKKRNKPDTLARLMHFTRKRITALETDRSGKLWIGTQGDGLYCYSPENDSLRHFSYRTNSTSSIGSNDVLTLQMDGDKLWIGTDGGGLGLYRIREQRFYSFKKKGDRLFTLADNAVLSLYKDERENLIWAGTVHGGFSFFQNQLINSNIPLEYFDIKYIGEQSWQILEDSRGDLWLGTGRDGLRRYDRRTGEVRTYRYRSNDPSSLAGDNVLAIFEDSKGKIWVGSQLRDVSLYNPSQNNFERFPVNSFSAFEEDSYGNIWVGDAAGITLIKPTDGGYTIDANASDSISHKIHSAVNVLMKDSHGDMWIGTSSGLGVLDTAGKYTLYKSRENDTTTISGNTIQSLFEDNDYSIWVGTLGNGLNHFNRRTGTFRRYGRQEGLTANHIRNIWEDKDRKIWISTNLGLSRLDPDDTIRNYDLNDGIYPSSPGLAYPLKNGNIAQGGINGLNIFDPGKLQRNEFPPGILFTSVELRGKEMTTIPFVQLPENSEGVPHMEIKRDIANFTINFISFNYLAPNKNQYAYKLSGKDDTWHNIGNQRTISFSYLPAGTYHLHLKGCNEHGIWNTQDVELEFTVLPGLWERTSVRILLVLIVLGVMLFFYRWRMNNIRKQGVRLQQQVELKTVELKKKQQEVLDQNAKLMESEKQNSRLKQKQLRDELDFKISELTNRTLRSVQKNKLLTNISAELSRVMKQKDIDPKNLKPLLSQINDSLTFDSNWDDFYQLFDQVHVSFVQRLRQEAPDLTERDIRLCALIKLNFSSQDIATIFGISPNSVKISKYRLRKKLHMDPETSFQEFFDL